MSYATNVPVLLASTTLGSATSTVTFSSIPQTYTTLYITGSCSSLVAGLDDFVYVRYNGVSTSSYNYSFFGSYNAAVAVTTWTNDTFQYIAYAPGTTGSGPTLNAITSRSPISVYIYNYTSTQTHWLHGEWIGSRVSTPVGNNISAIRVYGYDTLGAAITSLSITSQMGNMTIGSTFRLYGYP